MPLLTPDTLDFIRAAKVTELPGAACLHAFEALLMAWLAGTDLELEKA